MGESQPSPFAIESHAYKARSATLRSHLKKKGIIKVKGHLHGVYVNKKDNFDTLVWLKFNASRFNIFFPAS